MMNQSPITHVRLLEKLPYDIISNIFLYLDQQDCVNCMRTCREWYELIPQFTKANWETLRFGEVITHCHERNFGKHVKHVIFNGFRGPWLSKMIQRLLDCGCTQIKSLGKRLYRKRDTTKGD
ncbi:hypothetical protein BDC45DRAFT_507610 [Circinella umbellata]|nr:hypothetical protein BDC45DRAFT_507610 [Circinella umbellata]